MNYKAIILFLFISPCAVYAQPTTKSFLDQKLFDRFYIIDNKKNIKLNKNSVYFNNYQKQIKAFKFKIDLKNHNGKDKITLYRN